MRGTRRFWTIGCSAGILALLGVVATNSLLLVAGVGLALWLLANQVGFLLTARSLADGDISIETRRDRVAVGEPVVVRLRAMLGDELPFGVTVSPNLPASANCIDGQPTITLDAGDRTAETTFEVAGSVVGDLSLGPARTTLRDAGGFFITTSDWNDPVRVEIRPRAPRNLHVGEGGNPLTSRYGEHNSGTTGAGLEPYEVREYAPGDQLARIDWKATARLGHPHIREFELTTTHETVLLIDHRATMGVGPEGETKLDYLRAVGLSFVNSAASFDDPLGLYAVGDGGATIARDPAAGIEGYDPVRGRIRDLEPTGGTRKGRKAADEPIAPSRARTLATRLDGETAFESTLRPYFEATAGYTRRLRDRPLFRTVQLAHARLREGSWTVILTDDSNPVEVREAVKFARRNDGQVLLFLAPSVLYEPRGLEDLDRAFERYLTFEKFRTSLARMDRVSAFEVAPGDRLDAIIDRQATRRGRERDAAHAARANRRYQQYGEEPRRGLAYSDTGPVPPNPNPEGQSDE
jgi:uncharacterized protein (DUF58 family)